jgi:hypothetical protein
MHEKMESAAIMENLVKVSIRGWQHAFRSSLETKTASPPLPRNIT